MMKVRLFKLAAVSLVGVTLLSLAGCGRDTDAAKASKVAFATVTQNPKRQVWYRLNTVTPKADSQVNDILIQQKGKVTDYQVKGISLSQLNHKSVGQVIALAENNEERAFNRELTSQRANYRGELKTDKINQKNSKQYTYKKGIAQANSEARHDQKLDNQFNKSTENLHFTATQAYPVSAKVGKNKSGKQVTSETIQLTAQKWQYGTATNGTVKQVKQHSNLRLNVQNLMAKPVTVSGTKYIGYYGSPDALVTQTTNAKAEANFDTPSVHGVK
ncbi:hypothetical protein [Secundilactobacillus pentosiphilus]|nr:hypothetical protein [Secundilactobacillus pentosiphilus]